MQQALQLAEPLTFGALCCVWLRCGSAMRVQEAPQAASDPECERRQLLEDVSAGLASDGANEPTAGSKRRGSASAAVVGSRRGRQGSVVIMERLEALQEEFAQLREQVTPAPPRP